MNRVKYLIPNSITASSMLMGLASIYLAAREDFVMAAWLILWGVLLDKLDGTMARLLDACSEFGVQFDSFADFVVFGIAPASLIYFLMANWSTRDHGPTPMPLSAPKTCRSVRKLTRIRPPTDIHSRVIWTRYV